MRPLATAALAALSLTSLQCVAREAADLLIRHVTDGKLLAPRLLKCRGGGRPRHHGRSPM